MMAARVKISGLEDVRAALAEFTTATGSTVLRQTLLAAAKPIAAAAKEMAPYEDGELEASIKASPRKPGEDKPWRAKRGRTAARAYVNANSEYAEATELGTAVRRHDRTGKSTGSVSPDPFMRPALDSQREAAINIIKTDIADKIERKRAQLARLAATRAAKAAANAR